MKKLLLLLVLIIVFGPIVFVAAALETRTLVPLDIAVSTEDAQRTRALFREFRALTEVEDGNRDFKATEGDLQSAMRFATRAVPTARGQAEIFDDTINLTASIGLPAGLWLNISTDIAESEEGILITWFRFGRFNLPPHIIVPFVRGALNIVLGDDLGTVALGAVRDVRISGKTVEATVAIDRDQRKALAASAKGTVRDASDLASAEHVRSYWLALHDAATSKLLPSSGSMTEYPVYAIRLAIDRQNSEHGFEKEVEAALMAMAIYCGHPKFQNLVGEVVPEKFRGLKTGCFGTRIADRGDLRQHFSISAGLQAASNTGTAFAIGEYKELLDAGKGGSGFSFDDIAADLTGIRFAEFFLKTDPITAENTLLKIRDEDSFFPTISDLPSFMSEEEFKQRFGTVDSDAYKSMMIQIKNRIDRLPIFASS